MIRGAAVRVLTMVATGLVSVASAFSGTVRLGGLQVDHSREAEPLNVGARPVFSWKMLTDRPGARQSRYRLTVADEEGRTVWDSGEVADRRSVAIGYGGAPLRPVRRYRWSVTAEDETGRWCEPAHGGFVTGTHGAGFWTDARWIAPVETNAPLRSAAFARRFVNAGEIRAAYWSLTSGGVFDAFVNGRRVGAADMLKPGFTQLQRRRHAFTYEVTDLLDRAPGATNVLSAAVSATWWRDLISTSVRRPQPTSGSLCAVLTLRYADGRETRLVTDREWRAALAGRVRSAGTYEGETYDAREADVGSTEIGADWSAAAEVELDVPIADFRGAPVRLRRDLELKPVTAVVVHGATGVTEQAFGVARRVRTADADGGTALKPGEMLVIDFGQNCAAVPEFAFEGEAGTELVVRPAEMLNEGGGRKDRGNDGPEGTPYLANLRGIFAGIRYVFAGAGVERYLPRHTFFGYRYIGVTANHPVRIRRVRSVPVTSVPAGWDVGELMTGNPLVNRLVSNIRWGMYSNYLSIPMDCPQRNERAGWTADTQVFAPTATYLADVCGFLSKWMDDVRDAQRGDGLHAHVAPGGWYPGSTPGWTDAGVIVPWTLWRKYGDARIIDENWDSMTRYVVLLERTDGHTFQAYGDWLSYEAGDVPWLTPERLTCNLPLKELLSDAYRVRNAEMLRDMAAATGRTAAESEYAALAARLRRRFAARNLDADGCVKADRLGQCGALFALGYGLLESESARRKVRDALLDDIRRHGDRLQTGFLGTAILMEALTFSADAFDVACGLLLQRAEPSWLYSVDQGATTCWERWNSYTREKGFGPAQMNSFNHYAYGAVGAWMFSALAGIREAEPGYARIVLEPHPDPRLAPFAAKFDSPYGEIRSSWRLEDGAWRFDFTVPPNVTAVIRLPDGRTFDRPAGSYAFTGAR